MKLRLLRAIVILPGTAVVFVPALLLYAEGGAVPGWGPAARWAALPAGILLIALGLLMFFHTARLFLTVGKGTLAPWDPPRRLVVQGAYRHVRNPMIAGVLAVLLGEGLVAGSMYLLAWCAAFFIMNNLFFVLYEEPGLRKRFGREYDVYARNVPKWVPRIRPYVPEEAKPD